jgi:hypothetical protein
MRKDVTMDDKLELARRAAADKTNHRKKTWEARITRWFPPRYGQVWVHLVMDREPDRPMTARMSDEDAREMVVDLSINDSPSRPGLFSGDLDRRARIQKLRLLVHLGVSEDVAREVAGVE